MITLDMSSKSHEELIIKSGKYLAEALVRDADLQVYRAILSAVKVGDSTQPITNVSELIKNSSNETVRYLMH